MDAVVSMRRRTEGLPEGTTTMVWTEVNQPRQSRERYLLGEMFFDVGGDHALLPGSEAAPRRNFDARRPGIETNKLMRQHDAEGFKIRAAIGACRLDQSLELERSVRHCCFFEEKPRRQSRRHDICFTICRHLRGIKIEV